ncbi:MAG: AI-2E family transporter [Candidatus Yanofskybacteria bacterium]|nr:AI-2E family transporter [Candidatus Yanofskybacteria bacterium]
MAENNHIHVELSSTSILKAILLVLFFILLYLLRDILIVFLFAIIVASAVSPFVTWLEKRGLPRLLAVILIYLVVFGLFVFVLSLVIPFASSDLSQLTTFFPRIVEQLSSSLEDAQQGAPEYFDFVGEIQNLLETLSSYLQQISQSAVNLIVSIFGGVFSFIAIVIISFYLSVMRNGIESFLTSVLPQKYEGYAISLWKRSEVKVGRWLQGQLLLALIVGLIVYIGLSLMGIRFALIFAILAMALEIVPIAGPILAAIPPVILAFLEDPTLGLWVVLFYILVQQFENHILVPLIIGKSTGLNPVVVILALLIGGKLGGIIGAIIAVPIATVIVEVFDDLAKHKEETKRVT